METILLTGEKEELTQHFIGLYEDKYEIRLLTREPTQDFHYYWDPMHDELDPIALEGVDHILHLTGSMIAPLNLDVRRKDIMNTYRSGATALIGRLLMATGQKVKTFITASSTTYYGSRPHPYIHTEYSPSGNDFLALMHQAGEEEAHILEVEALAERSVIARFGHILCHYGGILPHITLGSECGIAFIHGSGEQIIPWIHISDACRILHKMIEDPRMRSVYNCIAPEWITYKELVTTAAELQRNRHLSIYLPKCVLRSIRKELAEQYLFSNRVSDSRLEDSGFNFLYPDIESALINIYDL